MCYKIGVSRKQAVAIQKRGRGRPPEPEALYRRVAEALRARMTEGAWPQGSILPSLRELAREQGVGPITVRGALEALRLEGRLEKTRGGRLTVREPSGVPAATHRLVVEIVSSYLDHYLRTPYGRQIQEGLTLEVTNQGRSLLLAHNWRFVSALPSRLESVPVEGVLLWGHFRKDVLRAYERWAAPVVFVDRPPGAWKAHYACVDNEAAARDATRRLIGLGHRRIAFIRQIILNARDTDPDTVERQRGYERGLRDAGLRPRTEHRVNSPASDTPTSPSIRSLFSSAERPTAVLAVDGVKAALVRDAAALHGLMVPRDLSVACFQEANPPYPEFSGPRVDFRELGRQAALLLQAPKQPSAVRRVPALWFDGKTAAPPPR